MRGFGRDLIRGGHCGQRSCEPHQKAEHMAAPTNAAKREKSSYQPGAVHTADMRGQARDVGSWGQSRPRDYERRLPNLTPCGSRATRTTAAHNVRLVCCGCGVGGFAFRPEGAVYKEPA